MALITLLILPLAILQFALMIAAVISIVKKPVTGNSKIIWLLIVLLISIIGPIIYFAIGSNKLDSEISEAEYDEAWRKRNDSN